MRALRNQLFAALCSPTILKMVSFAMIGVANALVDFGVFAFAYKVPGNASRAIQRRRVAGGSIRLLRNEHTRHLSARVGANSQARGLSKIRRFRNSGRICGDHDARRSFVFC